MDDNHAADAVSGEESWDEMEDEMEDQTGDESGDETGDETGDESEDAVSDELREFFDGFNCYDIIEAMGDEDLSDLHAIERIIGEGQRKRRVKFPHERIDWAAHLAMLQDTDGFDTRFRMSSDK
jgi:hypothetical protein